MVLNTHCEKCHMCQIPGQYIQNFALTMAPGVANVGFTGDSSESS